jgi:hypothetical protein
VLARARLSIASKLSPETKQAIEADMADALAEFKDL